MNDDKFLERLRNDAAPLRYEPDDVTVSRLRARVRDRIAAQATVAQLLAGWFRPMVTSIAALALAAVLGTAWMQQQNDTTISSPATVDSIASSAPIDVSVAGEPLGVN